MSTDEGSHGRLGSNGFSTKEMLVRLETVVDRIEAKLDAKAEKKDLDAFEIRQVAQEAAINLRLVALETARVSAIDVSKYKRWLVATTIAFLGTVTGVVALAIAFH